MTLKGIPLGQWSGADATDQLRETVVALSRATARQTRVMIWLTIAMFVLSVVTTVATVVMVLDDDDPAPAVVTTTVAASTSAP